MHPRVREFLRARDAARLRNDYGMVRAMTVELRRLGVSDDATLVDPTGRHKPKDEKPKPETKRRGAKPRCEHGKDPARCEECAQAEIEESLHASA